LPAPREVQAGRLRLQAQLAPYGLAIGGAIAVTAAIELITSLASVAGLSAIYLLLVLWLGARWGRGPAVAGSIASFLLYDYFFVPPVGTFTVSGTAQLVELVVLLAVALVTSQLAASLRRARASAEALAKDSRALYELATAALRSPEVTVALAMLSRRAKELPSLSRFALVAVDSGQPTLLAGDELSAGELKQAAWSHENGRPIGIAVRDGAVVLVRTHPADSAPAYLPLASGVAVIGIDGEQADADELRMLAALIGLADLLFDRRRAAFESERARGLESSDRLKTAILSSLSHELKSPIASLRTGLTALAAPRAGLKPEQRELLVDLDRQATRLDRMVGDLLALSRLESGLQLDREAHSFADIVGNATRQLRVELATNHLEVELPDDLPPVDVDEVQAGRLLANLLENAHEWAPSGGVIEVGAAQRSGVLEAWIENEGPPIATADLERVFETFWTRRARGSGLGLAICKRVVEAHGGTIRVENRRRGPRFTFTLPLAHVPAQRSAAT
jgi:two-component system, OmpR family, sensor histidine kinase KdpD